jgi:hypothetical protein
MNREGSHQDADAAIQNTTRIIDQIMTTAMILIAVTADGMETLKDILRRRAEAGAQTAAAEAPLIMMTTTGDRAATEKEEAGTAMPRDMQKQLKEVGKIAAEDRAGAILTMMIMTATGTIAAAEKEEAGTAILKDMQKQLKEAGRTVAEDRAEAALIMMITARIMIQTAVAADKAVGSEILKDMRKQRKEAGSIAGADHIAEARAANTIMTEGATREADHRAAASLQWTATR